MDWSLAIATCLLLFNKMCMSPLNRARCPLPSLRRHSAQFCMKLPSTPLPISRCSCLLLWSSAISGANAFPALTWGGFPGNDPRDVQSGSGQIGNFYCFENVEKSIMVNRFSNLHTFKLASSRRAKRQARTRARRISAVFAHMTFWRLVKFASAHFFGI